MSIRLASLFVVLGADGAELTKETKKARKTISNYSRAVGKIGANTAKVFAGVTASIAAVNVALAANFQSNRTYVKSLEGVAAKLGDTAGNIQALQYAGEQQQIAQSAINTGLQRMTRRLSEAAQGTGEARGALRELGVDAVALNKQLPTVALDEILTRLGEVPTQADRVRLAFKLFDTEGVDFVQLIGGLKSAKDELSEMGALLSDLDVSQLTAADTALVRLSAATSAIGTRFSVKLAPAVTQFADALFQSAKQGEQLEDVMDSVIRVSLIGTGKLVSASGQILKFVDSNADIVQYGAVGYLLLGRSGAALGATIGAVSEEVQRAYRRIALAFTGNQADQVVARIESIRSEIQNFADGGFQGTVQSIFGPDLETLEANLVKAGRELRQLEDQGITSLMTIETGATKTAGSVSQISNALIRLGSEFEKSANKVGTITAASQLAGPDPVTAANNTNAEIISQPDQEKALSDFQSFLARRDQMITQSNTALANSNKQAVKIFGDTQGTWTKFAAAGATERFTILSGELQQTLASSTAHSKKIFKLNKVVSYANAVVSGAQAAASALATQPFFPVGLAMLSFAVIKTGAILSSIRRQKFAASGSPVSAGGSPGSISGGVSSSGAANASSISDSAQNVADQQIVQVTIYARPGTSKEDIDQQTAESIARLQKSGKIRADAIIETNVIVEGVAA